MNNKIQKIENNVQDRNSGAWKKLCEYVHKVAEEESEEFSPMEELGQELFSQIHTLPETISKLKRIPPEIGQMESLEYFDPYTSYDLHWFPYEITHCKNLKDSRVSTRALYGNYKNRMGFPDLNSNPVRYSGETVKCSVCSKVMGYEQTHQWWISLRVGTDVLPLLVNVCSEKCKNTLPKQQENYVQFAHKGGSKLQQPPDEDESFNLRLKPYENKEGTIAIQNKNQIPDKKIITDREQPKLLKLLRKLWEK